MTPVRSCARCGAVLSQYNPGDICAACSRAEAAPRVLAPDDLLFAVASVLFGRAGEHVDLRRLLAAQGIAADHVDTFQAVQKLRRRGCDIQATPRRPGYKLTGWSPTFKFRRNRPRKDTAWTHS